MASGINRVILIGNIGADPECRYTQKGKAVCTLRLAVTERQKDGDAWRDVTAWVDVVTWDKTAENAAQFLKKGRQVYVEGRLQARTFKDKAGNDREKVEVVAQQVLFLGGDKPAQSSGGNQQSAQTQSASSGGLDDESLPF